nr:hypothetical protein [Tanacetum cinerariifolium]
MPKGLKNSEATLQRVMDKADSYQSWQSSCFPFITSEGARVLRKHLVRQARTYKVNVVADGPMEEVVKGSTISKRLDLWATKLKTHQILYVRKEEVEGQIMRKFFKKGEQVLQALNKNDKGIFGAKAKLQEVLIPTPRAWRLYIGRESNKEGSRVGMVLVDPEKKEHSHVICLNFKASKHVMDYEALLSDLVTSVRRQIKDLHVFVSSRLLVDQVEGNRVPRTKGAKRYREEVKDAAAPFHRF